VNDSLATGEDSFQQTGVSHIAFDHLQPWMIPDRIKHILPINEEIEYYNAVTT
jgi:hypothetical protein